MISCLLGMMIDNKPRDFMVCKIMEDISIVFLIREITYKLIIDDKINSIWMVLHYNKGLVEEKVYNILQ